jgi:PKD-like domain/Secretion system C-terminal sorting domain
LTITASTSNTTVASACDTYTWLVDGNTYTTSGSYTSVTGCATEILDLTITASTSNTTVASACDSYTWSVDGNTYTTSGSYTSVTGCATEILDLTITASTSNTTVASACDTYTWSVDGNTYTTSGSYTSVTGCATEILDLTITASTSNTTLVSACDTYTWSVDGNTYTSSGSYTSVTGCATEILDLTITASTSNTTVASACDSYTWSVDGNTYTTSGSYTSVTGCATEILDLTITASTSNTTLVSACDTYTWSVDGNTYTTSGSYTSVTGCATEILDLTIIASTSNTTVASACDSYTWSVDGNTYTSSGSYTSVTGCATEILDLTIIASTSNTTVASACDSYTWSVDGNTYTSSGSYTSVTGCATEILELTINTPTSSIEDVIACNTYNWNGNDYTSSGSYTFTTTNANGCDSTATLNLTINISTTSTTDTAVCPNALPFVWNGNDYAVEGSYTFVTLNAAGCDSTAILNLSIVQPPVIAGVTGPKNICTYVGTGVEVTYSIVSPVPGVRYTWTVSPGINVMNAPTIGNTTIGAPDYINVTFSSSIGTDNAQIRVYATDLCGQRSLLYVYYLLSRTLVTPTFAGNPAADICASIANGTTVTYTIDPLVGADSYCWNFTNTDGTPVTGVSVVSPAGYDFSTLCQVPFTSITVQYDASFISGNLTVAGINGCGLGSIRNLPITKAQKSVVISSPVENLCSFVSPGPDVPGEPIEFNATFNGVGGVFTWDPPIGFYPTSRLIDTVTGSVSYLQGYFLNGYTTGQMNVQVVYNCGVAYNTITLSATPPVAPVFVNGPTAICNYVMSTNNSATYTISDVPEALSYTWKVPDGCMINGQFMVNNTFITNQTSIQVKFPDNFAGDNITVTANSNCGSSPTTVLAIEACNGGKSSLPVSKNTIGLDNINVSVFPNPTTTEFRLNVNTTGKDQITVRVWDVQGKIIKTMKMMPYETIKFGNELKTGSYMVEVMQGNKKITQRVIKF